MDEWLASISAIYCVIICVDSVFVTPAFTQHIRDLTYLPKYCCHAPQMPDTHRQRITGKIYVCTQTINPRARAGANRATYAEVFPSDQLQAAFGTLFLSNALSATVGFYTFARLPIMVLLTALLVLSSISVLTYVMGLCVFKRQNDEKARLQAESRDVKIVE